MKVCVILLLATYGICAQNVTMSYIHSRWRLPVAAFEEECILVSRVKPRILDDFYQSENLPDDANWKCQLKCYTEKLQLFRPLGEIDVHKWADLFEYLDLPLAKKCARIKEPDLCQRAYLLVKCVHDELSKQYPP